MFKTFKSSSLTRVNVHSAALFVAASMVLLYNVLKLVVVFDSMAVALQGLLIYILAIAVGISVGKAKNMRSLLAFGVRALALVLLMWSHFFLVTTF